MKVGIQGIEGSFSEEAAKSYCEKFGIKDFKTYKKFGEKVYKIRENVLANIKKLKDKNEKL